MNPYSVPGINTFDRIVKATAKVYGIDEKALFDGRRFRTHCEARMLIWLFAYRIGKISQTKLTSLFKCSHSSISVGISHVLGYAKYTKSTGERMFAIGRELRVKDEVLKGWLK